ncbi:hypothetical protein WA158_004959 [Blastocystis sp. Blastoise]
MFRSFATRFTQSVVRNIKAEGKATSKALIRGLSSAKQSASHNSYTLPLVFGSVAACSVGFAAYQYKNNVLNVNAEGLTAPNMKKGSRMVGFIDRYYISDIVDSCMPGLVTITTGKRVWLGTLTGCGSGFIISESGLVVTNCHVALGQDALIVKLSDGSSVEAKIFAYDEATDICLLQLPPRENGKPYQAMKLGSSDKLRVGEWVIAMGAPLALEQSVAVGVISTLNRSTSTIGLSSYKTPLIQTDASINPGNSGGPLINLDGEVIGINTLKIQQDGVSGLGFAVPIDVAKQVIKELTEFGKVRRIELGIRCFALTPQICNNERKLNSDFPNIDSGLFITRVMPGSPASQAKIKEGDILVAVNDKPIHSTDDFVNYIVKGEQSHVKVSIIRDNKAFQVEFFSDE